MALFLLPAVRGSKNERDTRKTGAAHSVIARAGRCVGPASRPPEPGCCCLVVVKLLDQGAVAAAQRKHDSSRATATVVTL
jgi:hypothetical protein